MLFWELIKTAINGILTHKLRSLLTMLNIIIKIDAIITMISLGEGAKQSVTNSIKELGSNLLFVSPGMHRRGAVQSGNVQNLNLEDGDSIKNNVKYVVGVAPENSKNMQVKYYNKNTNTTIIGVTEVYSDIRNYKLETGRFINETDVRTVKRVCIIGKTVQTELFGELNPIGMTIKIKGVSFDIIGVLKEKGQSGFRDNDDLIFTPLSTFQKRLTGNDFLQTIVVQVSDEKYMSEVQDQIEELIRARHKIQYGQESDFNIRNQAEIISQVNTVTKTLTYLLAGVAAVSLLVGGIGIMNIMLVSVTERTREIGIRKAIGAKKKDILTQFLFESVMVSFTGGILGILTGYLLSYIASNAAGFTTVVTVSSILISFCFSIAVGLFFGIYPANKAANLKPIEALRYE
ncbi:ABC transporter permease [Candidatus Dependentiae bacterium]|nr:ABC transporter permease [Candidatus Dependentiae bacterium]